MAYDDLVRNKTLTSRLTIRLILKYQGETKKRVRENSCIRGGSGWQVKKDHAERDPQKFFKFFSKKEAFVKTGFERAGGSPLVFCSNEDAPDTA